MIHTKVYKHQNLYLDKYLNTALPKCLDKYIYTINDKKNWTENIPLGYFPIFLFDKYKTDLPKRKKNQFNHQTSWNILLKTHNSII